MPDHSIEFLRQKSEQRRAELKETISQLSQTLSDTSDEIKTTFSPRHLTQEARAYAKERGEQAVDTIREKVVNHPLQAMAIGAAAAYPLLGLARKVPIPLALIGAGLLLSRKSGASTGPTRANGKPTNGEGGFSDKIRSTLAETQDSVAAAGTRAKDAIASGAASAASGAASAAADVADRATRAGEQAGDAIASLVERNPLIIGGVAMAVGGFIAASLPGSRVEDRALGEAGAALKRSGRKMTASAIKSVKARVSAVADDMSAAAHAEGLTPEALDEAVSATADKVKSVAERAVGAALGREPNDQGTKDTNHGDENASF